MSAANQDKLKSSPGNASSQQQTAVNGAFATAVPGSESEQVEAGTLPEAAQVKGEFMDNPLYDPEKMGGAVEHANRVTRNYGVEVM